MSPPAWLRALDIDFDPEELRKKYEHERVVRLRPDGNDQYLDVATDEYRGLLTDPYVDVKPRAPLNESVLVAGGSIRAPVMLPLTLSPSFGRRLRRNASGRSVEASGRDGHQDH